MQDKIAVLSIQSYLFDAIADLGTNLNLKPVYWTTLNRDLEINISKKYPECIIHDQFEAILGNYPKSIKEEYICCPKLLESIQNYESDALSMLSRFELNSNSFDIQKRRILFKKVAGLWEYLILEKKIIWHYSK